MRDVGELKFKFQMQKSTVAHVSDRKGDVEPSADTAGRQG